MKLNLRSLASALLATATLCSTAQLVTISEQTKQSGEKEEVLFNTELDNYTFGDGQCQISIPKTNKQSLSGAKRENAATATVTFNHVYDAATFNKNVTVLIFNGEISGRASTSAKMPYGTYDMVAVRMVVDKGYGYLIKEQLNITGDTTITFDFSEVNLKHTAKIILPNGEERTPEVHDSKSNVIDAGNTSFCLDATTLYSKKYGAIANNSAIFDYIVEGKNLASTIITNAAEGYVVNLSSMFRTNDAQRYVCNMQANASDTALYYDFNADNWTLYQEKFETTYDGEYTKYLAMIPAYDDVFSSASGSSLGAASDSTENHVYTLYANTPKSTVEAGNGKFELYTIMSPIVPKMKAITEPLALVTKDGVDYTCTGWHYLSGSNIGFLDSSKKYTTPGHPQFTYTDKQKKLDFGESAPMNTIRFTRYSYYDDDEEVTLTNYAQLACCYLGRCGERRGNDESALTMVVKHNGDTICTSYNDLSDKFFSLAKGDGITGTLEVKFINENFVVDELAGKNETNAYYDMTKDDYTAPTLRMLMFKDAEGNNTDRFDNGESATIMLAGGDLNYDYSVKYFSCAEQTIEVNYSPYNANDWKTLTVSEVPENYYMPGFGYFYQGSLKDVQGYGEKGWFDLKIKLTDTSGNWQEQIISPAFRLKDHEANSIEDILTDTNAEVESIYTIDGRQVREMQNGINIVRYSNGKVVKVLTK